MSMQLCGIPGNEQAYKLAKCGAQEEQPSTSIHYQEKTTIIKPALKPRQAKDAYHLLDRPGLVVLVRLRSGHNMLNAHVHRKIKIVPSPTCSCGEEDQTTEHVLQSCNRHQPEGIAQWPSATPLHQKWYGGLEDLKKTSSLVPDWSCKRTRRRRRRRHLNNRSCNVYVIFIFTRKSVLYRVLQIITKNI